MATTHVRVTAEDRRLQIIEVARGLFASRGFEGTTTRELAESVGINEALLFRHFASKEELYWAVLQHMIDMHGSRDRLAEFLHSGMSDRETFLTVARDMLSRNLQFTRLLFFSALEKHDLSERFFKTHVIAYHEVVSDYIREGMAAGRLRKMDPLLAARAFIGMFSYHFQIQELFGGKKFHHFDNEQVATDLVDIWLDGMQPRSEPRAYEQPANGHKQSSNGSRRGKKIAEKVTK